MWPLCVSEWVWGVVGVPMYVFMHVCVWFSFTLEYAIFHKKKV